MRNLARWFANRRHVRLHSFFVIRVPASQSFMQVSRYSANRLEISRRDRFDRAPQCSPASVTACLGEANRALGFPVYPEGSRPKQDAQVPLAIFPRGPGSACTFRYLQPRKPQTQRGRQAAFSTGFVAPKVARMLDAAAHTVASAVGVNRIVPDMRVTIPASGTKSLRMYSSVTFEVHPVSSVDDVIAAVDVERLTGDQFGCVRCKEGDSHADVVDGDEAACWSLRLRLLQERLELRNP